MFLPPWHTGYVKARVGGRRAGSGAEFVTSPDHSPVPQEFSVRSMRMTAARPWTPASGAYTTAPAWTWWAASAVTVPQDTRVCTVRPTSMSVAQGPATLRIPGTAYRIQAATSAASAILASQVSLRETPYRNPMWVLPPWLTLLHPSAQGLAVRLLCPLVSPSHVCTEASAAPASAAEEAG